jgi:hypothetical protein
MANDTPATPSATPSESAELLQRLPTRRILSMTRYSLWPPEEAQRQMGGLRAPDVFALTGGPLLIQCDDDLALGMASDIQRNSILIWRERTEGDPAAQTVPLSQRADLYPVPASDPHFADDFWRSVIGATVKRISILVRRPINALYRSLPNEVGVRFEMESGATFVSALGLHNDTADFVVIPEQSILEELRPELREVSLGDVAK